MEEPEAGELLQQDVHQPLGRVGVQDPLVQLNVGREVDGQPF